VRDYNNLISAITMPLRIMRLPISPAGYPVPWFVQFFEKGVPTDFGSGEPDFRVADARKLIRAIKESRCWICGDMLGRNKTFTIGPMCAINRVISEPPQHRECSIFSAMACPFLTKPRMRRNENDLPEQRVEAPGAPIKRNPGAVCVWTTRTFKPFKVQGGILFSLGDPTETLWFAEGRSATRDEVLASIDSGYPLLLDMAKREGHRAVEELQHQRQQAMLLLPAG